MVALGARAIAAFVISSAVEKSLVLPGATLLQSSPVKRLAALIILLAIHFQLVAEANTLGKSTAFAMGGIGYAGTMSEGERALREVLARSDAVARLETRLYGPAIRWKLASFE